jgi:hypothetical protein
MLLLAMLDPSEYLLVGLRLWMTKLRRAVLCCAALRCAALGCLLYMLAGGSG